MTRILVFGKNGQLATALAKTQFGAQTSPEFNLKFVGSSEFNLIKQVTDIYKYILTVKPIDGVINASAYTDVDKAEIHGAEDAWVLNALAPEQMAKACKALNIPFFHVSTESVFAGVKSTSYKPNSAVSPANFYGLTKLEGEHMVQAVNGIGAIFRTSWVFSNTGHNFVTAIRGVARKHKTIQVVADQMGLPTHASDLANALLDAVRFTLANPYKKFDPVYHIAGGGVPISRFDFARLIVQSAGLKTRVEPITSSQFAAIAPRPKNAVLDTESFTSTFGIDMPDWQIGLKHMFSKTE